MARPDEPEPGPRVSVPNVAAGAARWYLVIFAAITAYLTVTNTLFIVSAQKIVGWPAIQHTVTGELLKAGGVALIASPLIVEVGRMVIAGIWSELREQKARQEGRQEGRTEGRETGRAEGRQEGRAEGLEAGRAEGRQEGRVEGLEAGRTEGSQANHAQWEAWLQRWRDADAKGIPFDDPPPQLENRQEPPR